MTDFVTRLPIAGQGSRSAELASLARHTLKVRRAMGAYCPSDLFRDSAWDMMLELFVARADAKPLCVKDLVAISGESSTSALRRIERLQSAGLLTRRLDPQDHRRMHADLTDKGYTAMVLMLEHLYNLNDDNGRTAAGPPKSFVAQQKR